ncbi:ubiquitin-related domain-containing protein [Syncephalis fuscata]|nr:ubiquitin-related domain-containing protein [Syncephalis fuscata]
MADQEDKKPNSDSGDHINLKVIGVDRNEVFFKIKRTTQLKKLMNAYCERQGKSTDSVRFLYDGIRIQPDDTPSKLDMEDDDVIDVMVQQVGGSRT